MLPQQLQKSIACQRLAAEKTLKFFALERAGMCELMAIFDAFGDYLHTEFVCQ